MPLKGRFFVRKDYGIFQNSNLQYTGSKSAADIVGLRVAFLGVYFGHLYKNPYFDGIASMLIGVTLTAVSLLLAKESRSLLMGEPAASETIDEVVKIARSNPAIKNIEEHLSMVLSPKEVLLILKPEIKQSLSSSEIVEAIQTIKKNIQSRFPNFWQVLLNLFHLRISAV